MIALTQARSGLFNPSVSIPEIEYEEPENEVTIQPNPAQYSILLRCSPKSVNYPTYIITNTKGQILLSDQLKQADTFIQLETFPRGMYFVSVQFEEEMIVKKLLLY